MDFFYTRMVQQTVYSPGQALIVPGGWGSQIPRLQGHEGYKFVNPRHRPPFSQEIPLVLISVEVRIDTRDIVRPEGLYQWKVPVTSSGIESSTFRLIAQCLSQLHHSVTYLFGANTITTTGNRNVYIYIYIYVCVYVCVCVCVSVCVCVLSIYMRNLVHMWYTLLVTLCQLCH